MLNARVNICGEHERSNDDGCVVQPTLLVNRNYVAVALLCVCVLVPVLYLLDPFEQYLLSSATAELNIYERRHKRNNTHIIICRRTIYSIYIVGQRDFWSGLKGLLLVAAFGLGHPTEASKYKVICSHFSDIQRYLALKVGEKFVG